jgi:hypothetical protein
MVNPYVSIGVGILGFGSSIVALLYARLCKVVLRDEMNHLNRTPYTELSDLMADERVDTTFALPSQLDDLLNSFGREARSRDFTRDEQRQAEAQQANYDRVMSEQAASQGAAPITLEVADPAKERQAIRAEHYRKYANKPQPQPLFALGGYADCVGCDVVITGPSVDSGKQLLVTVVSDAQGNYSVEGLRSGTFRIQPSKRGKTFKPNFYDVVIGDKDVVAPPFVDPSSPVDSRVAVPGFGPGPNGSVVVNGSVQYTVQTSCNPAVPGTDSRVSPPVGCGSPPQNSRM